MIRVVSYFAIKLIWMRCRPKSSLNPALAAHNLQGLDKGIRDIEGAAPWEDTRTIMRGIFDLANIQRM